MASKETIDTVAEETRTLLIDRHGEKLRVTIPAGWKVTFAVINSQDRHGESQAGRDLRIYEAGEHCRAVFTGVQSFRDVSIPVEKLVVAKSGESSWEEDGEGNTWEKRQVNVKKDWTAA